MLNENLLASTALRIIGWENKGPGYDNLMFMILSIAAIAIIAYLIFKRITEKRNKKW
jgi:hypothetical protein